jgi:hypothetical protein
VFLFWACPHPNPPINASFGQAFHSNLFSCLKKDFRCNPSRSNIFSQRIIPRKDAKLASEASEGAKQEHKAHNETQSALRFFQGHKARLFSRAEIFAQQKFHLRESAFKNSM